MNERNRMPLNSEAMKSSARLMVLLAIFILAGTAYYFIVLNPLLPYQDLRLHYAARDGDVALVEQLLAEGLDPSAPHRGASPGDSLFTPLHYAVNSWQSFGSPSFEQIVELLLKNGSNPNVVGGYYRETPLHFLRRPSGELRVAELLVEYGADVNARNQYGLTPLHKSRLSVGITELLLQKGADPNARDDRGRTPLFGGGPAVIETLLRYGADINIKNMEGDTVLLVGVRAENTARVKDLLQLGADVNIKDAKGKTPYQISVYNGTQEITKLLLEAGAKAE